MSTFELDESKFLDMKCTELRKGRKLEKKYNVKMNIHDLKLIEELANQFGCSQSQVISGILRNWVLGELNEFINKDSCNCFETDCAAAIALVADEYANLDQHADLGTCGTSKLFQRDCSLAGQGKDCFNDLISKGPNYEEWLQYDEIPFRNRYSESFGYYLSMLLSFMNTHNKEDSELYSQFKNLLQKINTKSHNGIEE